MPKDGFFNSLAFARLTIIATAICFVLPEFLRADDVQFNADVRPLLSDKCFKCHGPDDQTRAADLRLDVENSMAEGLLGESAAESEVVSRITSEDADLLMPPPESGLALKASEIQLLKEWINQGAAYDQHWSFKPIKRPATPPIARASAIDAFIQTELESRGLQALPQANALTQLRRVALDLTGLPPTDELRKTFQTTFEKDGIEVAYELAVDQLLASPRYGERMAWQWLEAARYADTDGYQNDGPREMWRWRDWVIDAYNTNMPFDQFTIEQLAGDLLPNATHSQLIATAFNRNNRYNSEAGIPIDEFLLENAVDRVDTTSTVWLGLTIGCARCHDHKYDPITQLDYYRLIDFFNDVAESGRAVKYGNSEPWIKTPTTAQNLQLEKLDKQVEEAAAELAELESTIAAEQAEWQRTATVKPKDLVIEGLDHYFSFDTPQEEVKIAQGRPRLEDSPWGKSAKVGGQGQFTLGKIPGLIGNGRFSVAFWMKPEQVDQGVVLSNEATGTTRPGILVQFVNGKLRWNIIHRWLSGVSTIETRSQVESGQWIHVALTNDGTQRADGMKLFLNGQAQQVNVIRNTNSNKANRQNGSVMSLGYSKHEGFWKGSVDELRFYTTRTLTSQEVALLAVKRLPADLLKARELPLAESAVVRRVFLSTTSNDRISSAWKKLQSATAARVKYWDGLPTTMIMRDLPEGRPSFVRVRGVYNQLGEPAKAAVPEVFPQLKEQPANRLAFAKWLVSDQNPLTARVIVNSYWQMLFGRGLVKTSEDFGAQGELPTHPELLDWLASEYITNGWDTKKILKTIVMSETYRRSSQVTSKAVKQDPKNTWYARASRRKLPGNVLRDQALAVSELLVEQQGGKSVNPYQPKGLWKEASNFTYSVGKGDELYRRSLYTYWKRTLSPPTMTLLDTANREWCSVRPKQTNTPLQALVLLNETTFAEAARKFAEWMLVESDNDIERLQDAYDRLLCRQPSEAELEVLTNAWQQYRREFRNAPEAAKSLLKVGQSTYDKNLDPVELAAATALANVILNLEEVTTRE